MATSWLWGHCVRQVLVHVLPQIDARWPAWATQPAAASAAKPGAQKHVPLAHRPWPPHSRPSPSLGHDLRLQSVLKLLKLLKLPFCTLKGAQVHKVQNLGDRKCPAKSFQAQNRP